MLIRLIFVYAIVYGRPTHVIGQHTFAPGWRAWASCRPNWPPHQWESFHIQFQFTSIMPVLWIHEKLS